MTRESKSQDDTEPLDVPASTGNGRKCFEAMLHQLGLPEVWRNFFVFVAAGESRFNVNAENTSKSEAAASVRAWDRNKKHLEACGHPAEQYTWGSGGWTGLLPANGLMMFDGHRRCAPPREAVHQPQLSLAMGVGFANGLTKWPGFKADPDWTTLRSGFGWPAKMGRDPVRKAERRAVYAKRMRKLGFPESWLDMKMPRLGMTADQAADVLVGVATPPECR